MLCDTKQDFQLGCFGLTWGLHAENMTGQMITLEPQVPGCKLLYDMAMQKQLLQSLCNNNVYLNAVKLSRQI